MPLQVFNTLSRAKEAFTPIHANKVRMYVCGITVYDYCHIGHARMLVAFDVIARWLRHSGYELLYVRNITDVDDKILARAAETGVPFRELTAKFIEVMHEDERALNIAPPDLEPRATDYIDGMKAMIAQLIENGSAYLSEHGDVYFSVKAFAEYGKLSARDPEELLEGARVEVDEQKRDPRDFALWKSVKADEPDDAVWDAPWGAGRPGWHIECSVMSTENLGASFDIHGGGVDLVFPHHENEIAQAEAATCSQYARYWLHNNAVRVDSEKMSKSLGNFFTIRDVLKNYKAEELRFFLLRSHYRSPINYSESNLQDAVAALARLYRALASAPATQRPADALDFEGRFAAAMDDDFGTPEAVAVLFELAAALNAAVKAGDDARAGQLAAELKYLGAVLGLLQQDPAAYLQGDSADGEYVEAQIAARQAAKDAGDYARADEIRQQLLAIGVVLEDSREGTRWRRENSAGGSK